MRKTFGARKPDMMDANHIQIAMTPLETSI
jgi:hypothetical protein